MAFSLGGGYCSAVLYLISNLNQINYDIYLIQNKIQLL
jgi:hypothetical protein